MSASPAPRAPESAPDRTAVGVNLTLPLFRQLSGVLAGQPYLKVVMDRAEGTWHLLDTSVHPFHVDYIAVRILGMTQQELDADLDAFNDSVYTDPRRRFALGVLSLHSATGVAGQDEAFMVLETTEADTMGAALIEEFYTFVRDQLDGRLPLLMKPANHGQEQALVAIGDTRVPRILGHELFGSRTRTCLNPGETVGRLRLFRTEREYQEAVAGLVWSDIVAMPRLPDDVPRVSGFISTQPTTPLSHTNVLAASWGIPNAIIRDLDEQAQRESLDGSWVRYEAGKHGVTLTALAEQPLLRRPAWERLRVRIDAPVLGDAPVVPLHALRRADRDRYGTKASNLGELHHVLSMPGPDLLGFYARPRPPRPDLLNHLESRLADRGASPDRLRGAVAEHLAATVGAPRGFALPFRLQHLFLTSSPALQQTIGKLKMALELEASDSVDALCLHLQALIRATPVPSGVAEAISRPLAGLLSSGRRLAVRSSANAEDLAGFSAAGLYESVTTVRGVEQLLGAVRQVWASLLSPRSVRLRHQAGISLEDTYMGAVVQEYVPAEIGGVMVTCDPTRPDDFRNVYLNCAAGSPESVVDGTVMPQQYLFNTVEGGGRTLDLGSAPQDLPVTTRAALGELALAGRLLQGHFGADDPDQPLDIEWLMTAEGAFQVVQIRPYTR
ncbi:PEP/pyruvate-binding domain-containing protein [Streptomyces sp. NPDC058701]|uniref:PEP/pyruvate-binding domain-containing protein n=1 Tax=Streptomyces sp. NPDC058701 TaxID=3346608 RepID=UPI00364881DC